MWTSACRQASSTRSPRCGHSHPPVKFNPALLPCFYKKPSFSTVSMEQGYDRCTHLIALERLCIHAHRSRLPVTHVRCVVCPQALDIGEAQEGEDGPPIKVLGNTTPPPAMPHLARANAFMTRSFGSVGAVSRL